MRPKSPIDLDRDEKVDRSHRSAVKVVIWELAYTRQAQKDAKKLASSNLRNKGEDFADVEALRVAPIVFLQ